MMLDHLVEPCLCPDEPTKQTRRACIAAVNMVAAIAVMRCALSSESLCQGDPEGYTSVRLGSGPVEFENSARELVSTGRAMRMASKCLLFSRA